MKKVISIVLALTLVLALFVPTAVNAEDTSKKLTIGEDFDVNAFGRNPIISTTQLVEKDGKWALKYSQVQGETDPFYALPNEYRNSFNGDYHYAVWDVYYEPDEDSIGTILSYRLNYAQETDGNVWMQRHVVLSPSQGGQWIKVLFDMTYAYSNALVMNTTPECWSASLTGTPYADGTTFNDSRVYFSTVADGNVGDNYYLHEIAMFKTEKEAYAYMGKTLHEPSYEELDPYVQQYWWYSNDQGLTPNYLLSGAFSTGWKFKVPEGTEAESIVIMAPTFCNNEYGSDYHADLYAWDTDYATSVAAGPIDSIDRYGHKDNSWMVLEFSENMAAGEYLVVVSLTGDGTIGVFQAAGIGNDESLIFVNDTPVPGYYTYMAASLFVPLAQITDKNGFYPNADMSVMPSSDYNLTDMAGTDIIFRSWSAFNYAPTAGFAYSVDGGDLQTEGLEMNLLPEDDGWRGGIAAAVGENYPVIYEYKLSGLKVQRGEHTYKIYALNGDRVIEIAGYTITDTETEEPVAPQTGDMTIAMFVVAAIVALAAVAVFKKRVVSR